MPLSSSHLPACPTFQARGGPVLTWSLEAVEVPTLLTPSLSQIMAKNSHPPGPLKGNPGVIYTWP